MSDNLPAACSRVVSWVGPPLDDYSQSPTWRPPGRNPGCRPPTPGLDCPRPPPAPAGDTSGTLCGFGIVRLGGKAISCGWIIVVQD